MFFSVIVFQWVMASYRDKQIPVISIVMSHELGFPSLLFFFPSGCHASESIWTGGTITATDNSHSVPMVLPILTTFTLF